MIEFHSAQVLVRLDQVKTFVLNFDVNPSYVSDQMILDQLSLQSHVSRNMLRLHSINRRVSSSINLDEIVSFRTAYTFMPILGGKGGFGTLLKGQSKQAGARQTTDFGACRDLNGRRLRHVNDEIKLRKWRENMARRMKSGSQIDVEAEFEALKTESGIRNWHLMTPSWGAGEMSNKMKRKMELGMKREIQKWAQEVAEEQHRKFEQKRVFEESVLDYSKVGQERLMKEHEIMATSIEEGLRKRMRTKELSSISTTHQNPEKESSDDNINIPLFTSSFLCTLSGDMVVEEDTSCSGIFMIQSKSEFATAVILLQKEIFREIDDRKLYYEVTIETAGISQIGWAYIPINENGRIRTLTSESGFSPNSDTGDGVGDDRYSYGMDGLRGLKFHCGHDEHYTLPNEKTSWRPGDVIGCVLDLKNKSLEYTCNGVNMGTAFHFEPDQFLFPAFSLNQNEIIKINIGTSFAFGAKDYLGISEVLVVEQKHDGAIDVSNMHECICVLSSDDDMKQNSGARVHSSDNDTKQKTDATAEVSVADTVLSKDINLETINNVEALEALGMDQLKAILFHRGLKCGGTLKERAERLFSVKGLQRDKIPEKLRGKNF